MERPFFSLSKQRRVEPIDYQVQNGSTTISVNVTAPAEIGLATIWDATSDLGRITAQGSEGTGDQHVAEFQSIAV